MENTSAAEQLWAHLDNLSDGNIFAVYPRILEEIFLQQERQREDEQRPELECMVLPSDMEWRLKAYFKLVQQQRDLDDQPETEVSALDKLRTARRWSRADSTTDPWTTLIEADISRRPSLKPTLRNPSISGGTLSHGFAGIVDTLKTSIPGSSTSTTTTTGDSASSSSYSSPVQNLPGYCGPPWGPRDVAKAARLLERPPLPVNFEDDQEMRRVYSLIYDVFRYKGVLDEALNDINFYSSCDEASNRRNMTWLLLLDQQRRGWARRECSKNSVLLMRMRDTQESISSRRKVSVSSDISSNSDVSVESSAHHRSSRRSSIDAKDLLMLRSNKKKEVSSETRELIRRARENLDKGSGTVLPILEDPKSAAKIETNLRATPGMKLPNVDRKNQSPTCQMEGIEENDNIEHSLQNSDKADILLSKKDESMNPISGNLTSDFNEITLEEIRNILKTTAGEIGDDLLNLDDILWNNRIKIAAAIAKIRIKNKALSLSDLLPPHLRDERVSVKSDTEIISGWVNVFKSRGISDLMQRLNEMGYSYSTTRILDKNQFHLDKFCPKFISVKPMHRKKFMSSSLVNEKIVVLEEREFCIGAAALCKAMRDAQLRGDIIQTHGTSPRAVGYLASQLRDQGPEAGGLLVFGAGNRKSEYEAILKNLGVTNVRIFSEPAAEATAGHWSGAVAALAPPPNSYSSVQDPIDLVCSRGGDLGMLEDLTESQINIDGKLRVMQILKEQKNILKLCMSKPQIQMILYETHSVLSTENSEMVKRAVSESNRDVRELHAIRRQKNKEGMPRAPKCAVKPDQTEETEIDTEAEIDPLLAKTFDEVQKRKDSKNADSLNDKLERRQSKADDGTPRDSKGIPRSEETKNVISESDQIKSAEGISGSKTDDSRADIIDPDTEFSDIKVPDCDLFEEILPTPLAGLTKREREGCFLALIQRKEMIKLNAKYMIQMAETRGLFGGSSPPPRRPQPSRIKVVKEEKVKEVKRRLSESQIERIAAPTHAWSSRISSCRSPSNHEAVTSSSSESGDTERSAFDYLLQCDNCLKHHAPPTPRARLWWRLAIEAYKADQPLCLPRGRAVLPLHVSSPVLNVESPIVCKATASVKRIIRGIFN